MISCPETRLAAVTRGYLAAMATAAPAIMPAVVRLTARSARSEVNMRRARSASSVHRMISCPETRLAAVTRGYLAAMATAAPAIMPAVVRLTARSARSEVNMRRARSASSA